MSCKNEVADSKITLRKQTFPKINDSRNVKIQIIEMPPRQKVQKSRDKEIT